MSKHVGWIAQMHEDEIWRNRPDFFPPPPITLRMTHGAYIAAKWWRDRIGLYQRGFAQALGDRE